MRHLLIMALAITGCGGPDAIVGNCADISHTITATHSSCKISTMGVFVYQTGTFAGCPLIDGAFCGTASANCPPAGWGGSCDNDLTNCVYADMPPCSAGGMVATFNETEVQDQRLGLLAVVDANENTCAFVLCE